MIVLARVSRMGVRRTQDQADRLRGEVSQSHNSVKTAVDNRLPLIEGAERVSTSACKVCCANPTDPQPNTRLRNAMASVQASESAYIAGGGKQGACDDMARKYAELNDAAGYLPPIIFEIDSDHNRAMLELAKRPYADRLKESESCMMCVM
jgi:hypothetical protein